jgi:phosphopantothenoylcysteine decarboxylase/phosphopantothenate--cysteine ligase
MLEPHQLREAIVASFADQVLLGRKVVVSAGPTYEDIDPVRFIGNRSSGRMGFAVAEAAAQAGARVTLVAGPVSLATPWGIAERVDVRSAAQMHAAVTKAAENADIYIGSAAVGDYRPNTVAEHKLKKKCDGADLMLQLSENPDILASLAATQPHPFLVGFAAETQNVENYARDKLQRKGLDMIAANQVGEGLGFETCDNAITLYWPDGSLILPRADKCVLARQLIECVASRYMAAQG